MKKAFIVAIIIVIVVLGALFISPKQNTVWNDSFTGTIAKQYTNMDCTCIGFVGVQPGLTKSSPYIELCYGLPIDCKFTCNEQIDGNWQTVPCNIGDKNSSRLGITQERLSDSQCNELCAEKGSDYYGDCAHDALNLNAERVGACSSCSDCGCYCLLPVPTH